MTDRYTRIANLSFDGVILPLPLSVHLSRRAEPTPTGSDSDAFCTNVQTERVTTVAEVRFRGIAAAEGFALGRIGTLCFQNDSTESGQSGRDVNLSGAVLTAVELFYEQGSLATAVMRFTAQADDGSTDPFTAEDTQ